MKQQRKISNKLFYILSGIVLVISYFIICINNWSIKNFNASISAIVYTFTHSMKGSNALSYVKNACLYCIPRILIFILIYIIFVIFINSKLSESIKVTFIKSKKLIEKTLSQILKIFLKLLCVTFLVGSILYVDSYYRIFNYLGNRIKKTTIYENYYVNPNDVNIKLNTDKKKNIIYIYLESMETSYASINNGGGFDVCYIPNLVGLATENLSFSNNEMLGGFINTVGTDYTMGALFATTSGIPLSFPISRNKMNDYEVFASGVTSLGDILKNYDYNQEFLCGSDSDFAGKKTYFQQHGNYQIYDLYTAQENGDIEPDYHNGWWGYEDFYLYEIAKKELIRLSENSMPFNFTMLTVDTHSEEGYICKFCENKYLTKTENVITCADNQLNDFINWCKEQEFFKNTIIVITGDHARMDNYLVDSDQRPIYNCFINCEISGSVKSKNRIYTPMDIFPTVLASLGFSWNGNRLGLGTNLFSNQHTLAEEIGFNYFNNELEKESDYYIMNFS